jgi:chromosome partitioning protein
MFDFLGNLQDMTDASVLGVLITKVDERKSYYRQTREVLAEYENIRVFQNYIHVDSAVEWSQDASKPVGVYRKHTRSAAEFRKLAEEVIEYGSR